MTQGERGRETHRPIRATRGRLPANYQDPQVASFLGRAEELQKPMTDPAESTCSLVDGARDQSTPQVQQLSPALSRWKAGHLRNTTVLEPEGPH